MHPLAECGKFVFAYQTANAQVESVIGEVGVVDVLLLDDERVLPGTDFDQAVPGAAAPRDTGDFQAKDGTYLSAGYGFKQALEAKSFGILTREALIFVDHDHGGREPAESYGAVTKGILSPPAFLVVLHLVQGGLTDVDVRLTLQMVGSDLRIGRIHGLVPLSAGCEPESRDSA